MKTIARYYPVLLLAATLLSGCAVQVGKEPGVNPPKLMPDPKDSTSQIWDHPGAFGPVPEHLMAKAKEECSSLDTDKVHYKAIGYHPRAMDDKGVPYPDGGYLCVRK
ncbi:hypothetical protein WH50_10785 [Pokkaliibacter plantistimulans]|uniref:Lipoprotein n=1 Tax=Pokkaliibacter plantistimulans TaxID=1635171 RepID=A0ABX5LXB0_9GAMM|nr:hypothetical protein [Pokkaliibacter plantistimulans]PXF31254.1 hypothetical protein WH50_10785 [Pokkaliibacter plantistimulans]